MAGAGRQFVVGRAGHVGPGAVGADVERAVGACHIGPGQELVGTVDIADGQGAADGDRRIGLVGRTAGVTGDHGRIVAAGDGDGHRFGRTHPALVVGGGVGEGDVAAGAVGQGIEVAARGVGVRAVGVEQQAAVAGAQARRQRVAGDRAIDVGGRRYAAGEHRVLAGALAVVARHRHVVGAGHGDGHRLGRTHPALVVGGGVGEGDVATGAVGQGIEVAARGEGVAAVGVEQQAAVAGAQVRRQRVADDRAIDVGGRRDAAGEHRVLAGPLAAVAGHGQVVDRGDRDRDRGGGRAAVAVTDGVADGVAAEVVRVRRVGQGAVGVDGHRAVQGRGRGDGERVAVDIAVVAEHGDSDRRVLVGGGGVVLGHRRVVGAPDGDGQGRGGGAAVAIGDGVGEHILQGLSGLQPIHQRIGIIDRIGVSAIGSQIQGAVAARNSRGHLPGHRADVAAGGHARDRSIQGGAVRTEEIAARHHVAARPAARVRAGLERAARVRAGLRPVVDDGDGQRPGQGGVAERIGQLDGEAVAVGCTRVRQGVGVLHRTGC